MGANMVRRLSQAVTNASSTMLIRKRSTRFRSVECVGPRPSRNFNSHYLDDLRRGRELKSRGITMSMSGPVAA